MNDERGNKKAEFANCMAAWSCRRVRCNARLNLSFIVHRSSFIVCFALLLLSGCGTKSDADKKVLATVGSHQLTKSDLSAVAGVSADSLRRADRVRLIEAWSERALVDLEGKRRHLDKDPEINAKLAAARSALYRAKLLSELSPPPPPDSAVASYYRTHQQDFLRPMEVYSIELYWSQNQNLMARFREQLLHGDTSMVAAGDITSEGKWLAEAGELDDDLQREVSSLKPCEVTFPRPYEDGYRVVRLTDLYPAGTVLDLPVVRDEIVQRLTIEQSRRRLDSLMISLRSRYAVRLLADSL